MKALIFAAGLGTRLRPLTNDKPKAMVDLKGKPLLQHVIEKLIENGFDEIIVNVHHFADLIIDFLKSKNNFGIRIEISDERDFLLDTGGGLKKAQHFFDDGKPFLVHNVDILSEIDLKELYQKQLNSTAIATLAVKNRNTSRYLLFDKNEKLSGWINEKTQETKPKDFDISAFQKWAFSGIQVIDPKIFQFIHQTGKFSIIEIYLDLMQKETIQAYPHDSVFLMDLGKPENLQAASQHLKKQIV